MDSPPALRPTIPALPDTWSATENVAWKVADPGHRLELAGRLGRPRLRDDRGQHGAAGAAEARASIWATGRPRRRRTAGWSTTSTSRPARCAGSARCSSAPPGKAKHLKNSYASETPVTDGERVYFYFGNVGLFAFDFNGKPVWSKPIGPFKTRNNWGTAASPVLHGDRVYIVNDNDEQSFLAAYDKRTGAEMWRVDARRGDELVDAVRVGERASAPRSSRPGSDAVRSYDLDGKLLWELKGMSTISIPTPFARHGLLLLSSGYIADPLRPAYAIRPGASGDISLKPDETRNAYIAWALKTGAPYNPTPLVYGDNYYTLFDRGFFTAPRRADRQGDLPAAADLGGRRAGSPRRRGPTTGRSSRSARTATPTSSRRARSSRCSARTRSAR